MDRASPGHFAGRPPKSEVRDSVTGRILGRQEKCGGLEAGVMGVGLSAGVPLTAPSWNGIQGTVLLASLGFPCCRLCCLI